MELIGGGSVINGATPSSFSYRYRHEQDCNPREARQRELTPNQHQDKKDTLEDMDELANNKKEHLRQEQL